jgi:hypothetical protein
MRSLVKYLPLLVLSLQIIQFGCDRKFDLSVLPNAYQRVSNGDTTYAEISPAWTGFGSPRAVMVGRDHLIYVADYDNNEVVMLDAAGRVQAKRTIPHPISLAQNSKLDLYVGGEAIAPNSINTIGAIYKISLVRFDTTFFDTLTNVFGGDSIVARKTSTYYNHDLPGAHMRVVWQESGYPARRFPGIGILPGNNLIAARVGPDNSNPFDPDSRILQTYNLDESYLYPVPDVSTRPSGGTSIYDIRSLTGVMVIPNTKNLIVTQTTDQVAYGAIALSYVTSVTFEGWKATFDPSVGTQVNLDFIRPYRFQNAVAATYDTKRNEIFILDAGLDSVMKFDSKGNFRHESFGNSIATTPEFQNGFNHPMGIAFSSDNTLYIADTGNKVIRRFKLSSQL